MGAKKTYANYQEYKYWDDSLSDRRNAVDEPAVGELTRHFRSTLSKHIETLPKLGPKLMASRDEKES